MNDRYALCSSQLSLYSLRYLDIPRKMLYHLCPSTCRPMKYFSLCLLSVIFAKFAQLSVLSRSLAPCVADIKKQSIHYSVSKMSQNSCRCYSKQIDLCYCLVRLPVTSICRCCHRNGDVTRYNRCYFYYVVFNNFVFDGN